VRVALIADIHGNLVALDAVLADLAGESIDRLVCLGDVAATGPQPREVVARLRGLGCPVVMGNADAFLASFQPTVEVDLGGGALLLCCHGSPRSFDEAITATTPEDELDEMLAGGAATIVAAGHTHLQLVRRHRESILLNPGSVGLPIDPVPPAAPVRNPPWAEYAIVTADDGRLAIELRRVPFDLDRLETIARAGTMPHAAWWIADWGAGECAKGSSEKVSRPCGA
jgi:putative phosphoesterase